MSYEIIVRPEAAHEVQAAFDWYEEKSDGLGLEFLRAADACVTSRDVRRVARKYLTKSNRAVVIAQPATSK